MKKSNLKFNKSVFIILAFNMMILSNLVGQNKNKLINYDSLKIENGFYYFDGELFTGSCVMKNNESITIYEGNYKNGLVHGRLKIYDLTGSLMEEKNYKDGKLNGKLFYYNNNKLLYDGFFKNGLKHKKWITYDNGLIYGVEFFKYGKYHGKVIEFREDGTIVHIQKFKNGKKHGKWVTYDNNGKVSNVEYYKNDEKVEKTTANK
jgi:hypothetical protein